MRIFRHQLTVAVVACCLAVASRLDASTLQVVQTEDVWGTNWASLEASSIKPGSLNRRRERNTRIYDATNQYLQQEEIDPTTHCDSSVLDLHANCYVNLRAD